jgi:ABC-2 type transport system ATP-binding protein
MKARLQDDGRESHAGAGGARLSVLTPEGRPHPAPVALRVEGLSKRYGTTEAVSGLNFEIGQGEIFGLLGPNGAGKTSTISMLATERRPSEGDATLFGHSVCKEPQLIRRMIGVAPQEIALYPMLTAGENLRFYGRMYGVKRADLADRVEQLLGFVGLDAHHDSYVETFSGGMKRRLNLAVALVHGPKLLLLDEPTAGVDPHSRGRIFDIVRRLRDAGNAILYTTHYLEEAEELCDRLAIIDEGKLVAMGTLEALLAQLSGAETIELRGLAPGTDLSALRARSGLVRIENSNGLVRLYVSDAANFLEPIQKIINRSAHPVRVKIAPPSLENLFLHLTGKELRD